MNPPPQKVTPGKSSPIVYTEMLDERQRKPNTENFIFIPAGVDVSLNIQLSDFSKRDDFSRSFPVFSNVINCSQGQTVNLGKIYFPVEIPINIKVLDPTGNKLEGVEVWLDTMDKFPSPDKKDITDVNGIARIVVPTNSKISFIIGKQVRSPKRIKQTLLCQIRGPEDANGVITFQLNNEVYKDLFSPK